MSNRFSQAPQFGGFYPQTVYRVTLEDPLADPEFRITAISDLLPGYILEWYNVIGGTQDDVTIYSNGTFITNSGVTQFTVGLVENDEIVSSGIQYIGPIILLINSLLTVGQVGVTITGSGFGTL